MTSPFTDSQLQELAFQSDPTGAIAAELLEARRDAKRLHERDILEVYSGRGGARQWSTAGAWLYPGDELCLISMNDAALAEGK